MSIFLSDTNCGFISDVTITVDQDPYEVDMDTAYFVSNGGSFNISSLSSSDTIGIANMNLSLSSFSADLIVNSIVSTNEILVDAIDQLTGANLGNLSWEFSWRRS